MSASISKGTKWLAALIMFLAAFEANAQVVSSYKHAIGAKVWIGAGLTYKYFPEPDRAVEGVAFFWDRGSRLVGLYEFNFDIDPVNAPGLRWYVGPGVHLGFYNDRHFDDRYLNGNGSGTYAGIDGVLGLDYKFQDAPINLSLDWQPAFEFGDRRGFVGSWGGLGIRYTF